MDKPKVEWFAQAEAQCVLRGITAEDTKYYHLLSALDQDTARRVLYFVYSPPEENEYILLKNTIFVDSLPLELRPHLVPSMQIILASLADHRITSNPFDPSLSVIHNRSLDQRAMRELSPPWKNL
ncbi:uncharacterized protein LOC131881225 [Tigriopus californicus]|uniref:uncharacterized protein LOC131881225 n=1 Tax=Tigriopus californicus TaxID=6832 RepID=UPI0027DA6724|nr:uncharacterized protein LOC131881225 [Tigriopus californicus]